MIRNTEASRESCDWESVQDILIRQEHGDQDRNPLVEVREQHSNYSTGTVIFCFREGLHVPAAIDAYSMLKGIRYAEPDAFLSDGPDIEALEGA